MITAIAAIGKNRELGKGNDLLWKIPEDLKRVKNLTSGHPLIMGRKTFESILAIRGSALPNRTSIVLTRDKKWSHPQAVVAHSPEEAIEKAKNAEGGDEIFIFGGAEIYALTMPFTDRLDLTLVDAEDKDADAYFPAFESEFVCVGEKAQGEISNVRYTFAIYERT